MADLADFDSPLTAALSVDDRDSLLNALKNKLNLGGFHADVLGSLSPKVRKRVDALREFQGEHDKLEANFFEERAALEAKYQKLYEPLYTKRYEIVSGIVEVDGVRNETSTALTEEKGVPDFWLNAMKSNEILAEEITERDEGALKYLKDIKWCRVNDPKGFKLEFFFDANPYFENTILTKTYHMVEDEEPILENAIGMEIEWYPGKILTRKILKKNPNKSGSKSEDCPSFFNFFNPPQVPDYDDEILDEEAAEELQSQMEHDYDIGSTIRDKIVPRAVSWFTGEAVQFDEYDDMEEGDNENEDEDEEREGDKAEKKKIERSKAGEDQQDERPPECKQQ